MTRIKDFEVTIRIKNNQVRERRLELGMTQPQFAKAVECSSALVSAIECMRESPFTKKGEWKRWAKRMAEFLQVDPDTLWPKTILEVKKTVAVRRMDAPEMLLTTNSQSSQLLALPPSEHAVDDELAADIREAMKQCLTPREYKVLSLRFGIDDPDEQDMTLAQVGKAIGTQSERARQIEAKALRKLRHPRYSKKLRGHTDDGVNLDTDIWSRLGIHETTDKDQVKWACKVLRAPMEEKIDEIEETLKRAAKAWKRAHPLMRMEYWEANYNHNRLRREQEELRQKILELRHVERAAYRWIRKRLRGENPTTRRAIYVQ